MIKTLKKYLILLITFTIWSIFYVYCINLLMSFFWHFNIFNKKYWSIIESFWQNGGVIDQFSEYMFLLMLILVIPCWILGYKKARRLPYMKIIFFPIFWYNSYIEKKYAEEQSHIVLKNISGLESPKQTSQQMMEQMISSRMPEAKDKKDLNSNKIRSVFEQKNRTFHKKMNEDKK